MNIETFKPPENPNEKDGVSRRNLLRTIWMVAAGLTAESALPRSLTRENKKTTEQEIWEEIKPSIEKLRNNFGLQRDEFAIIINPERQELYLIRDHEIIKTYVISTAKAGIGQEAGSDKTPFGTHRIKEKIGDRAEIGTIFRGGKNTKKTAEIITEKIDTPKDEVTTRIMWLDGQEDGINRGKNIDSHSGFIYIHGTPEEGLLGQPASHGCIRMKNADVIELFETVPPGTLTEIQNKTFIRKNNNKMASIK